MNKTDNDFDIKELDEIVAIEILTTSYGIDPTKLSKKEVIYVSELLKIASNSKNVKE